MFHKNWNLVKALKLQGLSQSCTLPASSSALTWFILNLLTSSVGQRQAVTILKLFISTLKPTLEDLSRWLDTAELPESHDDFFIAQGKLFRISSWSITRSSGGHKACSKLQTIPLTRNSEFDLKTLTWELNTSTLWPCLSSIIRVSWLVVSVLLFDFWLLYGQMISLIASNFCLLMHSILQRCFPLGRQKISL